MQSNLLGKFGYTWLPCQSNENEPKQIPATKLQVIPTTNTNTNAGDQCSLEFNS